MGGHPELETEQAYIDHAYACLDAARASASKLRTLVEVGKGGTEQARYEREVIWDTIANRLTQLHLGDASLVFGRIDFEPDGAGDVPRFYIGRMAVADATQEPIVVDWRAPIAEPFYRATGPQPMGLARRRHFASRGRTLLDIDDELFGRHAGQQLEGVPDGITGHGALLNALETARTGRLTDIVATIQGEQDRIIRSELPGVLVVQGGPGTGKTVVALHRAAYLLYTNRFPLEGQGVLVVGPNRLFLSYIEQVLPSLGEAGVELAVLADLVDDVRVRGNDQPEAARIKGDQRIIKLVAKAVRDRERPLRKPLRVPWGLQVLVVAPERTQFIVREARRRFRTHNAARRFVERSLFDALSAVSRVPASPEEIAEQLRHTPEVREALERMWPVLTPADLLHDLYGSAALLRLAGSGLFDEAELKLLERARLGSASDVVWTHDDVPVLDEAYAHLGARPAVKARARANGIDADDVRTFGHIVVDEAQDLSPMQLRMLTRRSLNGSMTIVGDIAQATGAWPHADWHEVLDHLPQKRPHRMTELTVGYRIPAPNMALAARVLAVAVPGLEPPTAVRQDGPSPEVRHVSPQDLMAAIADQVAREVEAVGQGNVAVICPSSLVSTIDRAFDELGVEHGVATIGGLTHQVTVVPVGLVKGLELDATVVVEPGRIIEEERQGLRALYVGLTRATKRLAVVHAEPLPAVLVD